MHNTAWEYTAIVLLAECMLDQTVPGLEPCGVHLTATSSPCVFSLSVAGIHLPPYFPVSSGCIALSLTGSRLLSLYGKTLCKSQLG